MSQSMPNLPKPMISLDRSGSKRPLSLAAAWLFSAVLLFAQAVDLSHNHEGDLQAQFDCDICLVTGSLSDALAAGEIGLEVSSDSVAIQGGITFLVSYAAVPRHARAPPIS